MMFHHNGYIYKLGSLMEMEDLTGRKFYQLTVLGFDRINNSRKYFWKCKCDCGKLVTQRGDSLKSGRKKSCGCLRSPNDEIYRERLKKRLLEKSRKNGECLEWTGKFNPFGYGLIFIRCSKRESKKVGCGVHRAAYFAWKGDIPDGMCVCHTCDNKSCFEISHLFLGTHQENMDDMKRKKRKKVGSDHHSAKLKEEDVLEIRKNFEIEKYNLTQMAKIYNVNIPCIMDIVKRKTWNHI